MYTVNTLSKRQQLKKLYRFYTIYGFVRTYIKTVARLRRKTPLRLPISIFKENRKHIGIIGCGQFAFATVGYFLKKEKGNCFVGAYDINRDNAKSFVDYYGGEIYKDYNELLNNPEIEIIYITSNHSTHTGYAIKALNAGKTVYIEKPISVTHEQFFALKKKYALGKVYVGYNRPFSPAIQKILGLVNKNQRLPLTLSCFISGHMIPADNWYRNPEEGTRVCGNIGHWLDLAVHIMNQIGMPEQLKVSLFLSSEKEIDDNLVINISSNLGDLVNIILTSRSEPFEGINESINFQLGELTAKINDFRSLTIWKSDALIRKKYFRKDVGHNNAILQPYDTENQRDFEEIMISTLLMLEIKEAVLTNKKEFIFNVNETNHTRP